MFSLVAFIPRAILQGMPLLFGCTGETISEKVGSLNLGIPGVMYVGAIWRARYSWDCSSPS